MPRIGVEAEKAVEQTSVPVDTQPAPFSAPSPQPVIVNVQQNVVHKIVAPEKPQSEPTHPSRRPPSPRGYADRMGRKSELHKCRTCKHEGMTTVTHWVGCCTLGSIGCCCFLTMMLSAALIDIGVLQNTNLLGPHICIPFCVLPCHNKTHRCPACNNQVGVHMVYEDWSEKNCPSCCHCH